MPKRIYTKHPDTTYGAPRAVVPADAALRIEHLAADGFTLPGVAMRMEIAKSTLQLWFERDPSLREAFERGRERERYALHNMLYRQAMEKDNPIAAMFLLKARHGYREGDQTIVDSGPRVVIALPASAPRDQPLWIENGTDPALRVERLSTPNNAVTRRR